MSRLILHIAGPLSAEPWAMAYLAYALIQSWAQRCMVKMFPCIISASLPIYIVQHKHSQYTFISCPMCRSVSLSVGLESVLWQNG